MNIGIIGSGTMGISIAHFMAQKNHYTTVFDSSKTSLKQGKKKVQIPKPPPEITQKTNEQRPPIERIDDQRVKVGGILVDRLHIF